jgi:DedD protein
VSRWHVAGLPGARGASTEDMRVALAEAGVDEGAGLHADIEQAYVAALAEASEHDRIVVFGSFHTVGAILRLPKNRTGVMAERKEADDSFNPRHRIVGAVVLVALAVILLPMLLKDRAPEKDSSATAPDTRTVELPVPPPQGGKPAGTVMPPGPGKTSEKPGATKIVTVPVEPTTEIPAAVKTPVVPAAQQAEAKPAPETKSVAASKEAVVAVKPAATAGKHCSAGGAFSQPDNARRLYEKLRQKGYSAILDPPNPQKGKTVRVEVGPYKDADAAKAAQARIQHEFGIKGVVRKQ